MSEYKPSASKIKKRKEELEKLREQRKTYLSTGKLVEEAGSGGGPSILSRTFDVLSRPLYGVAETSKRIFEGRSLSDVGEGLIGGLAGKNKTTFDSVLETAGMEPGWMRSALGFGLDIALDPTTYLGVGTLKGLGKGAVGKMAAQQSLKQVGIKGSTNLARELAQSAGGLATKELTVKGARTAFADDLVERMMKNQDDIIAKNKGKVFLKVAGKPVHLNPNIEEAVYRGASKVSSMVGDTNVGRAFNAAFRPKGVYKELHQLSRVSDLSSHARLEQGLRDFAHGTSNIFKFSPDLTDLKFSDLKSGELEVIQRALNNNIDAVGTAKNGVELSKYQKRFREAYDQIFEAEKNLGLYDNTQRANNYTYQYFKNPRSEQLRAWKNHQQKVLKETGSLPNVKEAERFGLKAEMNAGDVLAMRASKSAKRQSESAFFRGAQGEFSVPVELHLQALGDVKVAGKKMFKKKGEHSVATALDLQPVKSRYLAGGEAYFPKEIAETLNKHIDLMSTPKRQEEILRIMDKTTNIWKTMMTTVNPSHHIRNMMGDVWNGILDGVTNPTIYADAASVMKSWRSTPTKVALVAGKRRITNAELMDLFMSTGAKSGFYGEELAKVGMRPLEALRKASEMREDWARLAHFMHALKQEAKTLKVTPYTARRGGGVRRVGSFETIQDAANRAAARVRKYHFDYGDLSPLEKQIRKFVPFYTWQRKNIPLQLETLVMNPGKILAAKKAMVSLQNGLGVTGLPEPQIDGVHVTPQWLREASAVRLAGEGVGRNGLYWNPGIIPSIEPFQNLEGGSTGITSQILSMLNPGLTKPIEYATGTQLFSGIPTQGGAYAQLTKGLLPPVTKTAPEAYKSRSGVDIAKALGVSLYPVGESQMRGEAYRQMFRAKDILKERYKGMSEEEKKRLKTEAKRRYAEKNG